MDCNEECQESRNNDLLGEYASAAALAAAVDKDGPQLGFGGTKPGRNDRNKNPIMTVIARSGIHEIGVNWCCCHEAPEHDMQLMMAGLFPATFRDPKTAFTFQVLSDFHLENLECKTTPGQFHSRLRRLTDDEFPNTVPVGRGTLSASGNLTADLGQISGAAKSHSTVESAHLYEAVWFWVQ